jgi:hypothetical protein
MVNHFGADNGIDRAKVGVGLAALYSTPSIPGKTANVAEARHAETKD